MDNPLPDESCEWDNVKGKVAIKDEHAAAKLVEIMRSSEEWSDERKLLTIEAFRNSDQDKQKKLFNISSVKKLLNLTKEEARNWTGIGIFEQWKKDALTTLDRLEREAPPSNWFNETCVYKLLCAHIQFIKSCSSVKKKKTLDKLEETYGIVWNNPNTNEYFNTVNDYSHIMGKTKFLLTTLIPFPSTNRSVNLAVNTMLGIS